MYQNVNGEYDISALVHPIHGVWCISSHLNCQSERNRQRRPNTIEDGRCHHHIIPGVVNFWGWSLDDEPALLDETLCICILCLQPCLILFNLSFNGSASGNLFTIFVTRVITFSIAIPPIRVQVSLTLSVSTLEHMVSMLLVYYAHLHSIFIVCLKRVLRVYLVIGGGHDSVLHRLIATAGSLLVASKSHRRWPWLCLSLPASTPLISVVEQTYSALGTNSSSTWPRSSTKVSYIKWKETTYLF